MSPRLSRAAMAKGFDCEGSTPEPLFDYFLPRFFRSNSCYFCIRQILMRGCSCLDPCSRGSVVKAGLGGLLEQARLIAADLRPCSLGGCLVMQRISVFLLVPSVTRGLLGSGSLK